MAEQSISYEQFVNGLPPERKAEVERVWRVVRENMPEGYHEEVTPRFLTFKAGGEWYVALASQKNYISLYLMPLYVIPALKARLDASGKRLKCGKSCINFRRAEELPLEVIGEIVGATDAAEYIGRVKGAGKGK